MAQTNTNRTVKNWDRRPWHNKTASDADSVKLFRTELTHIYTGIIEGEGTVEYLFASNDANTGGFVALEKITGTVDGRPGSFILQHVGTFITGQATMTMTVLPGAGTGALTHLSGRAVMAFTEHLEVYPINFEYSFAHESPNEEATP